MIKLRRIVDNVYEQQHNGISTGCGIDGQLRTIITKRSRRAAVACLMWVTVLASASFAAGNHHSYTIQVDENLNRLQVTAHFAAPVTYIAARSNSAEQFLLAAHDCDSGERIRTAGRRMTTPEAGISCLTYVVDLQKAARAERRNRSLSPDNIVVSPIVWMWRPRLGGRDDIRAQFQLPDDVQVSVPWRPIESTAHTYLLTASPQSGSAIAIFGRFDAAVTNVAGSDLRIALLRSATDYDTAAMVDWIRDTANNIALVYGRFPNPLARIIIIPVATRPWRGDLPGVVFGRVVRDGGETVELLVDPHQPMESFYGDWTATHELSHMMLPFLRSEQRWISEGFAQYYQNVLLTRAGRYDEQYAWQKLHDGLERGRSSVPEMSPNEATAADERNSRMKVYWSGTALALLADIELRGRSDGKESLDTVLGQFQRCCLPSARIWTGAELFTKFDSFLDEPLFMNLYRQFADTPGFPDTGALLEQLGIILDEGKIHLSDAAELAEIRAALMARIYTDAPSR